MYVCIPCKLSITNILICSIIYVDWGHLFTFLGSYYDVIYNLNLFSGLNKRTTMEKLREAFSQFGQVVDGLFPLPTRLLKIENCLFEINKHLSFLCVYS